MLRIKRLATDRHKRLSDVVPQLDLMQEEHSATNTLVSESLSTWLVAKLGVEELHKLLLLIAALPESLPSSRKTFQFSGRETDSDLFLEVIEKSLFRKMLYMLKPDKPSVLAPPTSECYQCDSLLVENHNCKVSS